MKKGVIFTTDSALAVTVALTMATVSLTYIQDGNTSRFRDVTIVRTAHDMGLSLDRAGILSSNNASSIEYALNMTKPANTRASVEINRYLYLNGTMHLLTSRTYGEKVEGYCASATVMSIDKCGGYYISYLKVGLR